MGELNGDTIPIHPSPLCGGAKLLFQINERTIKDVITHTGQSGRGRLRTSREPIQRSLAI